MCKLFLTAAVISGAALFSTGVRADDMAGMHSMTGVLIDNACGAKQANEADATKHPLSCCKKDACAASGYQLIVGDKHYKLDDKGNELAKAYLDKADSTKVTVDGKMDGEDKIDATGIKAATDDKMK